MKTNIGVFFGGRSTEHEISVISASQAMHAINRERYDVTPIYITKQGVWYTGEALLQVENYRDTEGLLRRCQQVYMRPEYGNYNLYKCHKSLLGNDQLTHLDVALPVLHGSNGEDGTFQGVLDTIGIPYAGCNTLASANGMDKITMKMILAAEGIPVVDYVWFTDKQWFRQRDELIARIEEKLHYPVIVKPANLGSSVGIGKAANREELIARVGEAEIYTSRIIVEHMVQQLQEINCAVLGDCDDYITSVLEQPIMSGDFLSYRDKYMGGSGNKGSKVAATPTKGMQASSKRFPADLPEDTTKRIQFLAGETFRVLSCHGVARVDAMIDGRDGDIYVNEINTIPGSLAFYLWDNNGQGFPFPELIDRLIDLALKRQRQLSAKTVSYQQNIFAMPGNPTLGKNKGGKI